MLNKLTLTNFKRHQNLTIDFSPGINVVRGANEIGKSSMLHAIAYALFGARALPHSLEDCVTWSYPVSSLKVELQITAGGKVYAYKRSKNGAEVTLDGKVYCTGQQEVTALSATLLGADANTAAKLLLASQGGIRGALSEGPKALSQLIEDLAGFSTFDEILTAAQEKLALGSPSLLEERLKGAQATLEAATQNLPPTPDGDTHKAKMVELAGALTTTEASISSLDTKAAEAIKVWQEASQRFLQRNALTLNVTKAKEVYEAALVQVKELEPGASRVVDTSQIEVLKQAIAEGEDHAKRLEAYRVFTSLPEGPVFIGPTPDFEKEVARLHDNRETQATELTKVKQAIQTLRQSRFDSDTCSKCGQPLPNKEQIIQKNAEIDAKIAFHVSVLEKIGTVVADLDKALEALVGIRQHAMKSAPALRSLSGYCLFDDDFYPMKAVWQGSVPEGVAPDLANLRKQLSAIETEVRRLAAAKAQLDLAVLLQDKARTKLVAAELALQEFVGPDADEVLELTSIKDQAVLDVNAATGGVILLKREMEELRKSHETAVALWSMAQSRISDAQRVIDECQKDLGSLAFNNGLVKKLRAIRPLVANKLWSTVLASVSVMFSQMRKEESWVTKEKDGFRVNDQAVESLSGSTLDLLGLAVRSALLRTFIPNCGLLVLDEPMAACDAERSESMLGFLKSVQFAQTLLVSHEEISESVADNLIQL